MTISEAIALLSVRVKSIMILLDLHLDALV